jgi:uncharacterized protein YndB with AHSA1/START domain
MEITLDEEFNAPPGRVFAAITDMDSWHKWMQNLVRIEKLTEGPFAKGSQWREVRKMFGKEAAEVFEVTALEPGKSMELHVDGKKGASGRGEYRFRYEFSGSAGKTTMRMHGSITGMGCMGAVFGWMFKGMFRKQIAKDHAALRKHIEAA